MGSASATAMRTSSTSHCVREESVSVTTAPARTAISNPFTYGKRKLRCKLGRCMVPAASKFHHLTTPSSTFFTPVLPTVVDEHENAFSTPETQSGNGRDREEEYFSATDEEEEGRCSGGKRWSPRRRLDKRQLEVEEEDETATTATLDDDSPESGFVDDCYQVNRRKFPRQHHLSSLSSASTSNSSSIPSTSMDTSSSMEASYRDDPDRISLKSIASSTSSHEIAVK